MTNPSQFPFHHLDWIKAAEVTAGDGVLTTGGLLVVTHSQQADDGSWMLRFLHGVLYFNPDAPVAVDRG